MTRERSPVAGPDATFPRELVRASAGTGKTFRISSRIVGLLAHGARAEEILASTFTRKAAGEILDRVLYRLARAALDGGEARELARHAAFEGDRPGPDAAGPLGDRETAQELLERLVPELHRADVGTLDALFVRMARSYGLELGLPPGWTIADAPVSDRVRSEAIQEVLSRGDPGTLIELVRASGRGETTRRVHDRLVDLVDELHHVHRRLDPGARDPWSPFRNVATIDDPEAERRRLAERILDVELPKNSRGQPNGHWVNAAERTAETVRRGDWVACWTTGFGAPFLDGSLEYRNTPFPDALAPLMDEVRRLAAAELAPLYDRQAGALGRLVELYDEAVLARLREARAYRFEDVTHLLGRDSDPVGGRPDLHHRLDRRSEHVLLDEFQDTSPPQWTALRPLVDRMAAAEDGARAMVVVADPKQSIYGWRGADPELVGRVGRRYDLDEDRLYESYRSSPVVLEFVNRVFEDLEENPVLDEIDRGSEVATAWAASFDEHVAAPPLEDVPGHVRLEVGPRDEGRGSDRPRLMARAADRVAELRAAAQEVTIGVLTRTNRAVARLIHELRRRGVEASEEGGTPVDDAAPVAAVLALLRLADHPGDRVARYHVAATPLGQAVGYRDLDDDRAARRLAANVRRSLIREGYGPVLAGWTKALADRVDPGELRRLEQLVELGFRWEERAGLRPADFVRFVESERMTDPLETPVRVMTVHQAKGLEFDVVVLADLERTLTAGGRGGSAALPEVDPATGRVRRVFPYVKTDLRAIFPEIEAANRQDADARLRDEISWLYVAATRAAHALHLIVSADDPESGPGDTKSFARLVRASLGRAEDVVTDGDVLWERGDADWYARRERERPRVEGSDRATAPSAASPEPPGDVSAETPTGGLRVEPSLPRTRIFGRRTPSDLEEGDRADVARLLDLERGTAFRRGDVVHRWCAEIRWIEDEPPGDDELLERAGRAGPGLGGPELRELLGRFHGWLEHPAVRNVFSRAATRSRLASPGEGTGSEMLEVRTERPFAVRDAGEILTGSIDRLVVLEGRAGAIRAEIVDFKTDDIPGDASGPLADRVATYRPQLEAYRRAVARQFGVSEETVAARLVFLQSGVVREI